MRAANKDWNLCLVDFTLLDELNDLIRERRKEVINDSLDTGIENGQAIMPDPTGGLLLDH